MTKTNKKGLITVALCAVILAVGLLSAYIIRYEFWRIYGFFDGIGKGETGLVSELAMDEAETYRVNISEIRTADGVSFSNIMWLVNADHPLSEEDVPVVAAVDDKNSVSTYAFYDLQRLFSEVKSKFGKDLLLTSTYRTREYQAWV